MRRVTEGQMAAYNRRDGYLKRGRGGRGREREEGGGGEGGRGGERGGEERQGGGEGGGREGGGREEEGGGGEGEKERGGRGEGGEREREGEGKGRGRRGGGSARFISSCRRLSEIPRSGRSIVAPFASVSTSHPAPRVASQSVVDFFGDPHLPAGSLEGVAERVEGLLTMVHDVLTEVPTDHFDDAFVFASTGGSKPGQRGALASALLARNSTNSISPSLISSVWIGTERADDSFFRR